jgi:hypothetical protein
MTRGAGPKKIHVRVDEAEVATVEKEERGWGFLFFHEIYCSQMVNIG